MDGEGIATRPLGRWLAQRPDPPYALRGAGDESALIVPASDAVELVLRSGERDELRWRADTGGEAKLDVTWTWDADSADARLTVGAAIMQCADGSWRAALPGGDTDESNPLARPAAIRIRNDGAQDVALQALTLVTADPGEPPILVPRDATGALPPNVVVYVVDTLRRDRMSIYGHPHPTTPSLEKLGARSRVFDAAYAAGPSTTPSVSALFASRHPSELGGRLEPGDRIPLTLAETFERAGYATAAFQANYLLRPAFGYSRGFARYDVLMDKVDGKRHSVGAEELTDRVIAWLREVADRPFFLYVQSMDVHDYRPPDRLLARFRGTGVDDGARFAADLEGAPPEAAAQLTEVIERYDATVAFADEQIGRLLDELRELGVADRTIVLVTADHGEPLGQRGHLTHGMSLHEEIVHVPMILHVPGESTGRHVPDVVSLLDVAPTLAELAGLPVSAAFLGRSMLASVPPGETRTAYGTRRGGRWKNQNTMPKAWFLRAGPFKLDMTLEGAALRDLRSDGQELDDASTRYPITARWMREELLRVSPVFRREWREPELLEEDLSPEAQAEFEAQLRSLGYVE
jgi:arylsulfatase